MESRIKQDCSSKVKIIRTLSSDSICVLSVFFVFFFCRESSPLCFTIHYVQTREIELFKPREIMLQKRLHLTVKILT